MSKIVLKDFKEGDGYHKINLAYLNKEQVEEIKDIVSKWNHTEDEEMIRRIIEALQRYMPTDELWEEQEMVAWLEKQDKRKDYYTKQELYDMGFSFTLNGDIVTPDKMVEDMKKYLSWKEKQSEQKVSEYDVVKTIKERIIEHFDNHLIIDRCFSIGGLKYDILKIINEIKFENQGEQEKPQVYETEDGEIITYSETDGYKVVEPKFRVGDTMRTLQEAADNITGGLPVVVSIDNEYYHCTNELIAIKDQDAYEYPSMNRKQKVADKVEPEFKVGDWIVENGVNGNTVQITKFEEDRGVGIRVWFNNGTGTYIDFLKGYHLWTIEDTKDGDVLAEDSCIFIIQKLGDNDTAAKTYFTLYDDGDFDNGSILYFDIDSTKPATKEQRDTLFAAMKEAGYEWDAVKKESKRIEKQDEQKDINPTLIEKEKMDDAFTKMMLKGKTKWTEEDECYMGECISAVATKDGWSFEEKRKTKHWLKSLKQRM